MKKTRYSDEKIVWILYEADKDTVDEMAKRHGVSDATIYVWRKKFGSMELASRISLNIEDVSYKVYTRGLFGDD